MARGMGELEKNAPYCFIMQIEAAAAQVRKLRHVLGWYTTLLNGSNMHLGLVSPQQTCQFTAFTRYPLRSGNRVKACS